MPAYITWERFQANQERLTANRNGPSTPGAPREGSALLAGLVWCGRCGRRLVVRYPNGKGRPAYDCVRGTATYAEPLCQSLSDGRALDAFVAGQVLAALEPAALEASLAAVAEVERERGELTRHWELRRERARYEVERAERQYRACEPENRLVARSLERSWEEALGRRRQLEDEYERWRRAAPGGLSAADAAAIRALSADLPAVWSSPTTTSAERQRVTRLVLERVAVTVDRSSERVDVELRWAGGLVRTHTLSRPVRRYAQRSEYPRLVERLTALGVAGLSAASIAERLNAEGFKPAKRATRFSAEMVRRLMWHLKLSRREPHGSESGLGADEYRPCGLARKLDMSRDAVRRWMKAGWVSVRRDGDGHRVIWADADELRRLKELRELPRVWGNKTRLAELTRPKERPAR